VKRWAPSPRPVTLPRSSPLQGGVSPQKPQLCSSQRSDVLRGPPCSPSPPPGCPSFSLLSSELFFLPRGSTFPREKTLGKDDSRPTFFAGESPPVFCSVDDSWGSFYCVPGVVKSPPNLEVDSAPAEFSNPGRGWPPRPSFPWFFPAGFL